MSKSKRSKSLAEQIAELENPPAQDYDPEEDAHGRSDNGRSDNDDQSDVESQDSNAGREHYEKVGKSKLRKAAEPILGPEYAGTRVGRAALDDGDEEDFPDQDFEDSDDEPRTLQNGFHDDEESEITGDDEDKDEDDSQQEVDDESASDMSDVESTGEAPAPAFKPRDAFDTAKLKKLMNEESKTVAASVGAAAKADAEKGAAVKTQRKTFDSLLNMRIRLQKALIATNTATVSAQKNTKEPVTGIDDALKAAEGAALNLLNSLSELQTQFSNARTGSKRKRTPSFAEGSTSERMWATLNTDTTSRQPIHDAILDRWSEKSRPTTVTGPRRLAGDHTAQPLTSVLKSQLTDPSRLVARTQQPRSCAPGITSQNAHIYDDADYYGLLLKELLEQRTSDANGVAAINVDESLSAQYRAAREAKTKRVVDTRASKGRKMRYTVHEKLQNFMAPDERGTWSERQADELFSSLLGKRAQLDEAMDVQGANDDDDDIGGLALY